MLTMIFVTVHVILCWQRSHYAHIEQCRNKYTVVGIVGKLFDKMFRVMFTSVVQQPRGPL